MSFDLSLQITSSPMTKKPSRTDSIARAGDVRFEDDALANTPALGSGRTSLLHPSEIEFTYLQAIAPFHQSIKMRMNMSTSPQSNLAQTACVRCREQKLRCTRQLPQCARCTKMNISCIFPRPPDRREIAVQRENRKRGIASLERADDAVRKHKRSCSTDGSETLPTHEESFGDETAPCSISPLKPETHRLLQDIYFACMFNSSLTFHRPTFDKDYANGGVEEHVLQAMYAMTARLLSEAQKQTLGKDTKAQSMSWALEAGRTALQTIDQPSLPAVQTCLILAMFWFMQGDYRRNTMFAGIAYRGARCMVQDIESETSDTTRWLEFEQIRRCFWSAWQMKNVNSDQYAVGSFSGPHIMGLELPASETAFLEGRKEVVGTLRGDVGGATPSLMAEFMKLVLLWARVRDYIETNRTTTNPSTWADAFALYSELTNWQTHLDPSLKHSKRNIYNLLILESQPMCLLLYALHHQSSLVLHASLVPSLSGYVSQYETPSQVVRVSAEIALEHAQALAGLASDVLALEWEFNKIAPFFGYAIYVAAAVILIVTRREGKKKGSLKRDLVSCLMVLKGMKGYWRILEQLWDRLQRLYELQTATGPIRQDFGATVDVLTDVEDDARNINEVLNDSVLYFSLRRLQNGSSPAGTTIIGGLDEILSQANTEQISNLLDYHPQTHSPENLGVSIPQDRVEAAPFPTSAANDFTTSSLPNQNLFENWREWNLDPSIQAQLSFDDLFGMDLTFQ